MLDRFIAYLYEQLDNHGIYVWGGQGQRGSEITEAWIRRRETSSRNAERAIRYWKKQVAAGYGDVLRAFDCSGLGVYFLLNNGLISRDMTSDGMLRMCRRISFSELKKGDFVFNVDKNGRAYHVGYIVDGALNTIEAKGRDHGVMKAPFKGWDVYGRPPFFMDDAGHIKSRILKLVKPYMRGEDVRLVQAALKKRGVSTGAVDGIYGPLTEKAVRALQADARIAVDGKAGPDTFGALGLEYYR